MALSQILLEKEIKRKGLDAFPVGNIHDEIQYDVAPSDADEYGRLSVECMIKAGQELNMNVPLDGEWKKGETWSRTH